MAASSIISRQRNISSSQCTRTISSTRCNMGNMGSLPIIPAHWTLPMLSMILTRKCRTMISLNHKKSHSESRLRSINVLWYQLLLFYFLVSIPAIVLYSQGSGFSSVLLIHTLLPLGILSTFPLILWSRFVMPKIRSIWVWCLLPVLVYVSFWLILWPIDLEGFPYDLLV